jgi:hypothetical protein
MNQRRISLFALTTLCLGFAACSGSQEKNTNPALSPAQQTAKNQLVSLQQLAAQTAQTYKNMDVPSLLNKLAEQSAAKKEPFNSLAYRELKGRTDIPADSLLSLVNQTKSGTALLPLLLLRKLHEKEYSAIPVQERAAVLTDALQNSKTFNTWGLPHLYLEDASKAMIESGQSAAPALKRMLSDTRPAPVFGSKEYMEYKRYQYRLCDYALFFLEKIQANADFKMSQSPADRDAIIKGLSK